MTTQMTSAYGATLARLSLGTVLLAHGLLKVLVFSIPGTVGFFASLGLPALAAYLVIFGEIFGGVALILGVYSRLTALLSMPILIGALWTHIGNGWLFSNEGGGWEFPLLLIALAGMVALLGNGAFALRQLPVVDGLILSALKS